MKWNIFFGNFYILLIFILIIGSLWGCPTRRYIPDPLRPQPQVLQENQIVGKAMRCSKFQLGYNWRDVIFILKGEAPLVGPAPWFVRMLA